MTMSFESEEYEELFNHKHIYEAEEPEEQSITLLNTIWSDQPYKGVNRARGGQEGVCSDLSRDTFEQVEVHRIIYLLSRVIITVLSRYYHVIITLLSKCYL